MQLFSLPLNATETEEKTVHTQQVPQEKDKSSATPQEIPQERGKSAATPQEIPQEKGINSTVETHCDEDEKSHSPKEFPLYVTFIWNQHQPMYKNPYKGTYRLPWVRLHGVKSYYPMVRFIDLGTKIKGVFNITPSLITQIQDYERGMRDKYFILSAKSPQTLSYREKNFILQNFFVYPRFARESQSPGFLRLNELKEKHEKKEPFTSQDILDLQLLHNLAWVNPLLIEEDYDLKNILDKKGNYTQEEKDYVLDFHINIMKKIISAHRDAQEKGKVEMITTPYYHPILPLLIDNFAGQRCSPQNPPPEKKFQHPEDARFHIKKALMQYKELYRRDSIGMWPSEQAVSAEIIPLLSEEGIQWIVSDEHILSQTLGIPLRGNRNIQDTNQKESHNTPVPPHQLYVTGNASENLLHPQLLYKPWRVSVADRCTTVLFRDQYLSDLMGFRYSQMKDEESAEDLIRRLSIIKETLQQESKKQGRPFLVTIALDGENCWENYSDDSRTFFMTLYDRLEKRDDIIPTTPGEFIAIYETDSTLEDLATGSWNGGNLDRWVGSPSKNRVWDLLYKVREDLVRMDQKVQDEDKRERAWESLYMAEGSDFPWWLDSMPYDQAVHFDALFRMHLKNVYRQMEAPPPSFLSKRIITK